MTSEGRLHYGLVGEDEATMDKTRQWTQRYPPSEPKHKTINDYLNVLIDFFVYNKAEAL